MKNPVKPPGIDPGTVRLVARRLNHYATPGLGCCKDILYHSGHLLVEHSIRVAEFSVLLRQREYRDMVRSS